MSSRASASASSRASPEPNASAVSSMRSTRTDVRDGGYHWVVFIIAAAGLLAVAWVVSHRVRGGSLEH
jgi:hypothetical protein